MLYIHTLKDLTPKSADIESVQLIRELKKATPFPFTEDILLEHFSQFFISSRDKEIMARALKQTQPVLQDIKTLMATDNPAYEIINIQRAKNMIEEIPRPLINSLVYAEEITLWQEQFIKEVTPLLNNIPQLQGEEEKKTADKQLNDLFQKLLRSGAFTFNYTDLVHEGQRARINDLYESLTQGFFFHVSMHEHLDKKSFSIIRQRIPPSALNPVERITETVAAIKEGIEVAYNINMRIVEWTVHLYSYIKWLSSK